MDDDLVSQVFLLTAFCKQALQSHDLAREAITKEIKTR